jgi:hypothetical protein
VEIDKFEKIGQRFFHMAIYEWRYSPVCIPEYPRPHSEAAAEQSYCVLRPLTQATKERAFSDSSDVQRRFFIADSWLFLDAAMVVMLVW